MTTDGQRWREALIPTGRAFHTHAMAATAAADQLIAATSAWRARLHLSSDGGTTWRQAYDHPTPERRVSRIVDLATLGERVFGILISVMPMKFGPGNPGGRKRNRPGRHADVPIVTFA